MVRMRRQEVKKVSEREQEEEGEGGRFLRGGTIGRYNKEEGYR